jgi:hypothetical protein
MAKPGETECPHLLTFCDKEGTLITYGCALAGGPQGLDKNWLRLRGCTGTKKNRCNRRLTVREFNTPDAPEPKAPVSASFRKVRNTT